MSVARKFKHLVPNCTNKSWVPRHFKNNLPHRWVATQLNEGSTAHWTGCLQSKLIVGRLWIVVNAKFVPKDCYFAVVWKFYFCAVAQCLKNKPRSSNLGYPPEKGETHRAIDDSTKQLLKARNMPLCSILFVSYLPINKYILNVNNRNIRKSCRMCSKFTIKTSERRQ